MGGGDNGCGGTLLGVTSNKIFAWKSIPPFGLYVASWENAVVIYSDTRTILSYLITWSFSHWFILTGLPSVTSLTYNNRSKTLTCTTTGGPATAVTWKRNGVVITHNAHHQIKSLLDRIKSTYRTVLTIGSSVLAGNYSCTVGLSSKSVVVTGTNWTLYSTPPCFGLLVLAAPACICHTHPLLHYL